MPPPRWCSARLILLVLVIAIAGLHARSARAQFSAREGYSADGSYHWSFELTPYLFLPAVDGTVGLNHPPGTDISISRPRPTISKLASTLTGAFVGDALVRFGPWSGEIDIDYIAAQQKRDFPPLFPGGGGATLTSKASFVRVAPGFGYQVLPSTDASKVMLDVRAGFTYYALDASSSFAQSRFGGVSVSPSFAQPWLGLRGTYIISPRWRVVADAAVMGLGVDGGSWGWNARAGVSYLIAKWFDVSLGYAAIHTSRHPNSNILGQSRSIDLTGYGPVVAFGFRF